VRRILDTFKRMNRIDWYLLAFVAVALFGDVLVEHFHIGSYVETVLGIAVWLLLLFFIAEIELQEGRAWYRYLKALGYIFVMLVVIALTIGMVHIARQLIRIGLP